MADEIVEYKIMQQSSNGWFLLDDSVIHLTREQAAQGWGQLIASGENPSDLKIVRQNDPRYPTLDPRPGFIPGNV